MTDRTLFRLLGGALLMLPVAGVFGALGALVHPGFFWGTKLAGLAGVGCFLSVMVGFLGGLALEAARAGTTELELPQGPRVAPGVAVPVLARYTAKGPIRVDKAYVQLLCWRFSGGSNRGDSSQRRHRVEVFRQRVELGRDVDLAAEQVWETGVEVTMPSELDPEAEVDDGALAVGLGSLGMTAGPTITLGSSPEPSPESFPGVGAGSRFHWEASAVFVTGEYSSSQAAELEVAVPQGR